jgi:sulfur carrier protein ThiS
MVKIRLISYLSNIAGYKEKMIKLDEPTKIRELISFPTLPEDRIIILVNERGAKLDTIVRDSDEIKVLPVVGGG